MAFWNRQKKPLQQRFPEILNWEIGDLIKYERTEWYYRGLLDDKLVLSRYLDQEHTKDVLIEFEYGGRNTERGHYFYAVGDNDCYYFENEDLRIRKRDANSERLRKQLMSL